MKDGHLPDGFDPKVKNQLGAQILPMQVLHWLQMPGHVLVEPQECQCPVSCPIEGCWPVPPSPLPSLLQGHLCVFLAHYSQLHHLMSVSYTHLRAHETRHDLVCRLLLEKKKK